RHSAEPIPARGRLAAAGPRMAAALARSRERRRRRRKRGAPPPPEPCGRGGPAAPQRRAVRPARLGRTFLDELAPVPPTPAQRLRAADHATCAAAVAACFALASRCRGCSPPLWRRCGIRPVPAARPPAGAL